MKVPNLTSERLFYTPISINHLSDSYLSWMNDPEVVKFLETEGNYTEDLLKKYILEAQIKDIFFWGIHLKESGMHIGNIKIDPINLKHGLGEYGILMGNRLEWGKGYANEASLEIINYCFHNLNLRKLTLGVVEDNFAAASLYKKLGFIIEGCYKNHGFYDGRYCNILRMALFNNSYIYERK